MRAAYSPAQHLHDRFNAFIAKFGTIAGRLDEAGARYVSTLLGEVRLAFPELLVELEATAVQ